MRILVLFAHPVETSFASGLHAKLVEVLRAKGHKVDDCDLYAEGFDPVMSRQNRIDYHNVAVNRRDVAPYVDRLLAAEALVFSFPVWNMGFPAMLKGFVDKVFLPGVSFTLDADGAYNPCLHNIKRLGVVCTYGGSRWLTFMMGDPPRRFLTRSMRRICAPGARCDYLAHYDMNHSKPERRAAFLGKSRRGSRPGEPGSVHSVSTFSSPSIARRCLMSSAPAKSMKARTRGERRRSEWVSIQRPWSSSGTR